MSKSFMILCLIVVVIFAPVAATNAYADSVSTVLLIAGAAVLGYMWLDIFIPNNYLPDQQDPAVEKHLDRLNAVQFTGPESQGRAEQQGHAGTNAGVTYTLFEW